MEKIIVQLKMREKMEENKMNIYDEILNKCADFLGYDGKINADEACLVNEIEKLKKLLIINDDLNRIKKLCDGKTIFVCYDGNSAYLTDGKMNTVTADLNERAIKYIFKEKIPCLCFLINNNTNTYQETDINSVINYLFL